MDWKISRALWGVLPLGDYNGRTICNSVSKADMKSNKSEPDDTRLGALLREARTEPTLPPRFQENVWRRIEKAEASGTTPSATWLDALAGWLLRPRLAFSVATMLVLVGVGLGLNNGVQAARSDAQARYLAAVAPSVLH
jgi:hypothetical protein